MSMAASPGPHALSIELNVAADLNLIFPVVVGYEPVTVIPVALNTTGAVGSESVIVALGNE
jgi:hypothetical protein